MARKSKDQVPAIHRDGGFFEMFAQLQDKIRKRAFEIFTDRDSSDGDALSDWVAAESEVLTSIAMNFEEEDDKYVLRGEIPGFEPDEVDIHVDHGMLSVGGSHRTESKKKSKKGEQTSTSEVNFFRRMSLPADANPDALDARIANGVLEVVVPKTQR